MQIACSWRKYLELSVSWTQSGNRFRFRFVFVSCVRACVRACEAVWVREGGVSLRWRLERRETRLRPGVVLLSSWCYTRGFQGFVSWIDAIRVGFLIWFAICMLYAWVLRFVSWTCSDLVAIVVGFKEIFEILLLWSWVLRSDLNR